MKKNKYIWDQKKIIPQLIKSKVHFGSSIVNWNPQTKPYLLGKRSNLCFFNIEYTIIQLRQLFRLITSLVKTPIIGEEKSTILFIGFPTYLLKKLMDTNSNKSLSYIAYENWFPGILTNGFLSRKVIKKTINDITVSQRNIKKRKQFLSSFLNTKELYKKPSLIVIFSSSQKSNLNIVKEAYSQNIPVAAFLNSNNSLDFIDYPILGNIKSVESNILYWGLIKETLKNS
jgi:ribosomal protein S2